MPQLLRGKWMAFLHSKNRRLVFFGSGIRNSAFLGIEMRQNLDEHVIPPHFLVYRKRDLVFLMK